MPQVPYNPVPDVQPQSPGEQISINTPGAAFGENIGAALEHLGTTTSHVGDELFSRAVAIQDLANETEARNKVIDFTNQAGLRQADFDSLKGIEAKNNLPGHLKAIADLRSDMRGTLSSPMAQKYFDQEAASFQTRAIISSSLHAGQEFKNYATGTAQARVDNTTKAYVDPFSEDERSDKNKTIENESHTIAGLQGWSEDQRQAYVLKQTSINRLGQIEQQAMENPIKAYDTLQSAIKNNEIDQASADRARDRIWQQNRGVGVENQAKGIFTPGKSLTDMDAEAHKASQDPAVTLGDPMFEKDLRTSIRTKAIYDKSITNDQRHGNATTVMDAIHSDKYHTLQELLADPEIGSAIHSLPSKDAEKIPGMLQEHWAKHNQDQWDANFTFLDGLRKDRPDAFMDMNLYDKNIPLRPSDRGVLIQGRREILKNQNANPQVQRAISWMLQTHGQELADLHIERRPAANIDPQDDRAKNYYSYVGTLSQAVEAFQTQNGHPPNPQEFEEKIAKPLLKTIGTNPSYLFGLIGGGDIKEFQRTFPEEVMTQGRKDIQDEAFASNKDADYKPSDNEVRMYLVRKQWDDFYKKAKASGTTGP